MERSMIDDFLLVARSPDKVGLQRHRRRRWVWNFPNFHKSKKKRGGSFLENFQEISNWKLGHNFPLGNFWTLTRLIILLKINFDVPILHALY